MIVTTANNNWSSLILSYMNLLKKIHSLFGTEKVCQRNGQKPEDAAEDMKNRRESVLGLRECQHARIRPTLCRTAIC